jgi:large subunit ribosomal protein L13
LRHTFDAEVALQVALSTGRPTWADIFTMKTYSPKPEQIQRRWYVVDAGGQVLGRVATEVATLLRGKHKPIYAPHMDTGDHVIVINADKIELTGKKAEEKMAYRHSGYPGGIKGVPYGELLAVKPIAAVERAVRGMLPKNRLGRQMIKKLHVVPGPEHPHVAQKPVVLALGERPAWSGLPGTELAATPAAKKPAAKTPAAKKPAVAEDVSPEPSDADQPAARKPAAKKPAAKKPAAKKPAAKKPAAKKPAAKKTAAKKPAAKKTAAKAKTSEE